LNNFHKKLINTKTKFKMKNLNKNSKKAFSLVEISIVILIIGLLIAGISKAGDMIFDVGLKSASSLTKGAKVGRMAGLALWLETTTNESILEKERYDGTVVSIWRDINPQSSSKFIFKKIGSPTYVEKGQNNLPAIGSLSASNYFLPYTSETSSTVTAYQANQIFSSGALLTIFMVLKPKAIAADLLSFCPYTSGTNLDACTTAAKNISLGLNAAGNVVFSTVGGATGTAATSTTTSTNGYALKNLIVVSAIKDATDNLKLAVNGASAATAVVSTNRVMTSSFSGTFRIGGVAATDVELYEVIVFASALSDLDRLSVETYLGKKYNVVMTKTPTL